MAHESHRSLVQVRNDRHSGGAGVVWDEAGQILTNAHVIHSERPTIMTLQGETFQADVVKIDRQRDLALLWVADRRFDLPPMPRGDSRRLRPGHWVMSTGHPWGVQGAATAGGVIAVGPPPQINYPGDLIQVGMQLRPGHSGGPMVDGDGRLVGLNTMISGPQVGLAIPIHVIEEFVGEMDEYI